MDKAELIDFKSSCEEKLKAAFEKSFEETFVELGIPICGKAVSDLADKTMRDIIELIMFGETAIEIENK